MASRGTSHVMIISLITRAARSNVRSNISYLRQFIHFASPNDILSDKVHDKAELKSILHASR